MQKGRRGCEWNRIVPCQSVSWSFKDILEHPSPQGASSQSLSTNTRTLVNSVYHGRYFDSIYPCEVRGHSPETGKARNTKGGSLFAGAVSLAVLFHLMNHSSSMPAASVITFALFASCSRSHTFHRSVSWYTTTRHFPTWDSFLSRKCVPDINFYDTVPIRANLPNGPSPLLA